jgi:hydroxymethylpyrimidine/phosphomethylpyrimidine kinase
MSPSHIKKVLIIAGSDSGGGAGVQADIKACMAHGAYSATAITALTVQNTMGVSGVFPVPAEFVKKQIEAVLSDIGADCIKTGMLFSKEIIEAVAGSIKGYKRVVDPVMIAKGGAELLQDDAIQVLTQLLCREATLITPNIPEAEKILGYKIDEPEMAARELLAKTGAQAVMLKGGHSLERPPLEGGGEGVVVDILATPTDTYKFSNPRILTKNTHGTGCTLASSIAALLAQNVPLVQAVDIAIKYVHNAIKTAVSIGSGHSPVNHSCNIIIEDV